MMASIATGLDPSRMSAPAIQSGSLAAVPDALGFLLSSANVAIDCRFGKDR
jgi:hypothetical protein